MFFNYTLKFKESSNKVRTPKGKIVTQGTDIAKTKINPKM